MNPWITLLLAGILEMGWPLGFKLSTIYTKYSALFIIGAAVSMALSGLLLYIAQKSIPISTAYIVWTGIGAIGTFLFGVFFFGDSAGVLKCLSVVLILAGVIGLKIF